MDSTIDMSTPVTRGELKEELARLESRFDHKLEHWGGALLDRLVRSERRLIDRITSTEQRMLDELARTERRLFDELARHTGAIQESLAKQVSAIDDKYRDLPPRVYRLEASVFGPGHEP